MGSSICERERLHSWKKGYLQRMQDQAKNPDMQHTAQDRKRGRDKKTGCVWDLNWKSVDGALHVHLTVKRRRYEKKLGKINRS